MNESLPYMLDIYYPDSRDALEATFKSESPFGTISVGDILAAGGFKDGPDPVKPQRVTKVVHYLWEIEGRPKHKICIYTEEMKD